MEKPAAKVWSIGDWRVDFTTGEMVRNEQKIRLDERALRLLLCLTERAGEVVSIEEMLDRAWPGVTVSQDSVYQAITSLRRVLGDDPKQPVYIATVPRLGYRMVAAAAPWTPPPADPEPAELESVASAATPATPRRAGLQWVAVAAIALALAGAFLVYGKPEQNQSTAAPAAASQRSIAVLPFLDLTEGMKEEEFADGMTEELIDKLSKVPGLHVPAPTASFYYKGKQLPVADIAKSLSVAYVLDGSVRKSGGRVRIAARLVRADNSFVIWTETYDRPFTDLLMIQDDIAGEVTKALRGTIAAGTQ